MKTETLELLNEVSIINDKYENNTQITGENFNIFRIMRMESDEMRMHSRFIGELLNPRGSHGQKSIFLKLFIETFKLNIDLDEHVLLTAEVKLEESIKYNRIDTVIKFKNNQVIVIENKIHAGDQNGQLARYKYCYPKCELLYLTLHGREPSIESLIYENIKLEPNKDYFTKSYKTDVLQWIENSKEVSNNNHLRETLSQYIYTIKHLTNQTASIMESKEIVDIIINNSNKIVVAELIFNEWENIRLGITDKIQKAFSSKLNSINSDWKVDIEPEFGKKGTSLWCFKTDWKYCITFYFGNDFRDLCLGISLLDKDKNDENNEQLILNVLNLKLETKNYPDWIWVRDYQQWDTFDWKDLAQFLPDEMVNSILDITQSLESSNVQLV